MNLKNFILTITLFCITLNTQAKQYYGSFFGMKSDGITVNTGSLQRAIDYISNESPGDTLTIWVGRYITGSIELKSNVTIYLREGAILVSIPSAYDYNGTNGYKALLWANNKENINIYGLGVLEGHGAAILEQINEQREKGFIKESVAEASPSLMLFNNCKNVSVKGIILQNACADAQKIKDCTDVKIDSITVFGKAVDGSNGLILNNNKNITVSNSYIQTSGTPIKSTSNINYKAVKCKL